MALPRLIVIADWSMGEEPLLRAIREVVELGPEVAIQHRHPGATGREFLREARLLAELCARRGSPLFVNGRLDVALLVDAHLHLPGSGPDVGDVRELLPTGRWISVAVHDAAEAVRAAGADLALVSPVFGAGSKPGDTRSPIGAEGFRRLASQLTCPAFALGGVEPGRVAELPREVVAGVAVVSAVVRAESPRAAAEKILRALG